MRFTGAALLAIGVLVTITGCSSAGSSVTDPPSTSAAADPNAPVAAFYGDSYTLGTGASDPSLRWSTIICEQRGWTEVNPSVNGLGFINNRGTFGDGDLPSAVIASDPDILFVTMGLNDNFSYASRADEIEQQITDDFDRLQAGLPDARIIVVEPFWYADERPASLETIIGWVRGAAAAHGWEFIPGASHWIEGHPEWMASDRLHPNDEGYAEMASRMDEELDKLGL